MNSWVFHSLSSRVLQIGLGSIGRWCEKAHNLLSGLGDGRKVGDARAAGERGEPDRRLDHAAGARTTRAPSVLRSSRGVRAPLAPCSGDTILCRPTGETLHVTSAMKRYGGALPPDVWTICVWVLWCGACGWRVEGEGVWVRRYGMRRRNSAVHLFAWGLHCR